MHSAGITRFQDTSSMLPMDSTACPISILIKLQPGASLHTIFVGMSRTMYSLTVWSISKLSVLILEN